MAQSIIYGQAISLSNTAKVHHYISNYIM